METENKQYVIRFDHAPDRQFTGIELARYTDENGDRYDLFRRDDGRFVTVCYSAMIDYRDPVINQFETEEELIAFTVENNSYFPVLRAAGIEIIEDLE